MKLTVSRGATINIGNYESSRIDVTIEGDVDDGHDLNQLDTRICEWLNKQVRNVQQAAGLPNHAAERFTGKKG